MVTSVKTTTSASQMNSKTCPPSDSDDLFAQSARLLIYNLKSLEYVLTKLKDLPSGLIKIRGLLSFLHLVVTVFAGVIQVPMTIFPHLFLTFFFLNCKLVVVYLRNTFPYRWGRSSRELEKFCISETFGRHDTNMRPMPYLYQRVLPNMVSRLWNYYRGEKCLLVVAQMIYTLKT